MQPENEFWKNWWNERARDCGSDFSLNRATALRLEVLEQRAVRQFIEAVNPQPDDVILDAGCGSGRNISLLGPLVKEVVGIDYSDEMLQRAGKMVSNERLSNVKLIPGDVTRLPFGSDTFDKVVCASVLQYLEDEDCAIALREMVRICKPGGRLIIHAKNGTSLYGLSLKWLRPVAGFIGRQMKPEHYRSRSWHETTLEREGGIQVDYDGFGILTFVPLPQWAVAFLLQCEMRLAVPKLLKKYAVNYKMTIQVDKSVHR